MLSSPWQKAHSGPSVVRCNSTGRVGRVIPKICPKINDKSVNVASRLQHGRGVFGEVSLEPDQAVQYKYSARARTSKVVVVKLTEEAMLRGLLQQLSGDGGNAEDSDAFSMMATESSFALAKSQPLQTIEDDAAADVQGWLWMVRNVRVAQEGNVRGAGRALGSVDPYLSDVAIALQQGHDASLWDGGVSHNFKASTHMQQMEE
eukprot:1157737-Pelagomonas_calceolata.AAC.10